MKKKKAFTFTEALLVLVLLGVIAAITIPQLLADDPTKKGWDTKADKMVGYLIQASTEILLLNAGLDDFTRLSLDHTIFSIEDADASPKISKLYSNYISHIAGRIDLSKEYFSKEIVDYKRVSTGEVLKDAYNSFLYTNDGIITGFRTYGSCLSTETHANPPAFRTTQSVPNICGSIFIDVNGYSRPNKLGSDQYIIPIDKHGVKFEDN